MKIISKTILAFIFGLLVLSCTEDSSILREYKNTNNNNKIQDNNTKDKTTDKDTNAPKTTCLPGRLC